MQVTLVHNPKAGGGSAPDADELVRLGREAGHEVRYQSAKAGGWAEVLQAPADLVAAAGGDGTVGRVARRMIGRGVPMTAISLGTANNIARSLGLADLSIADQIAGWRTARRMPLDAGLAVGAWGRRFFIEGVGIGLFPSLIAEHRHQPTPRVADTQAVVTSAVTLLREFLRHQRAKRIHVTIDGTDISGEYLLFEIMNMPLVGPNLYLAPGGHPGDGLLDVVVVPRAQRQDFDAYLAEWEAGHLAPARLPTFRGRDLVIRAGRHALHIDDWLAPLDGTAADPTQPAVRVQVLPAALEFLVP
jgi:diacylglycerol kinase family enzyme